LSREVPEAVTVWEIETAAGQFKTYVRGAKIVLRKQDAGTGAAGILQLDDAAFRRLWPHA
jgi:hypothetical protein